jgi:hypothetical protein
MKIFLDVVKDIKFAHLCNTITQIDGFQHYIRHPQQPFLSAVLQIKPDLIFIETCNITKSKVEIAQKNNIKIVCFGPETYLTKDLLRFDYQEATNILNIPPISITPFDVLISIDKISENIIHFLRENGLSFKIVGAGHVGTPEYVGNPNVLNMAALYKSCKIIITNAHLNDVAINKGFALCGVENQYFPLYNSDEELTTTIVHYLQNDTLRQNKIKEAYKLATQNTYFHILSNIFAQLNFNKESELCLQAVSKVLGC